MGVTPRHRHTAITAAGLVFVAAGLLLTKSISAKAPAENIPVCPPGPDSKVTRCHARVIVNDRGKPNTTSTPAAYGPAQFLGAYNLTTGIASATRTIAVVDAYDNPNALSDLNFYSNQFGIPKMTNCPISSGTSSSPCFQKVDQDGGTSYPSVNSGWALESSLDVQIAHAICQNCNLLLVEANSNSYSDLMTAVDRAVAMGANVVSNSYGSSEFLGENTFDSHFNVPGVAFTFSAGDSGYGTSYPAASRYVTSVGGTSLYLGSNNTYSSESVWSGTGSGCSKYEAKPTWQHDTGCTNRTLNDVSADADPATGAAVYDSTPYSGQTGWFKVGGTSLSSPLIAAVYALSGNTSGQANSLPYGVVNYTTNLHDVTSGKNGNCKRNATYLCTATSGYDGPTGLGTPNGTSAF